MTHQKLYVLIVAIWFVPTVSMSRMSDMQKQECLQTALACLAYLMQLHPIQHNSDTHPAHTSSLINYEKTAAQHPNSYNPETTSMETKAGCFFVAHMRVAISQCFCSLRPQSGF
jgi:hypothetical protein